MDRIEQNVTRFFDEEKMNCAQSAARTIALERGLDADALTRTMTAFGGGICGTRNVCGAVSGALAAMCFEKGISDGRAVNMEGYTACEVLCKEFIARFEEAQGTLLCGEIIGVKRGDAEGWARHTASGGHASICKPAVLLACRLAVEILEGK